MESMYFWVPGRDSGIEIIAIAVSRKARNYCTVASVQISHSVRLYPRPVQSLQHCQHSHKRDCKQLWQQCMQTLWQQCQLMYPNCGSNRPDTIRALRGSSCHTQSLQLVAELSTQCYTQCSVAAVTTHNPSTAAQFQTRTHHGSGTKCVNTATRKHCTVAAMQTCNNDCSSIGSW